MQSFVCKHKINWNRFQPQTPWKSLRSYTSSGNNNLKHFLSGSVHSRFFATQSRGPIPLKKDPKFNAYFGVAHPSYWKPPLNITITGSSGQIGYNLLGQIASGEVFGKDQPVHITMLECHETDRDAYGVIHEIRDGTYPLLLSVQKLQSEQGAFDGADYVIMAHSKPATEIQDETLRKIYNKQEEWDIMDGLTRRKVKQMAIDFHNLHTAFMHAVHIHNMASWNVKIFVISNPVARMCNLVSHFVPRLEEKFITGLSRTHHNRFTAMLAREFQCRPSDIQQTCVWGSTTDSYIPDFTSVLVKGRPIHELVKGDFESWKHRMIDAFLKRDTEVESLMKDSTTALANDLCVSWRVLSQHPTLCVKYASERPSKISPVVSATSAAIQHLQDWVHGTNGRWTSMVVSSDNHYDKYLDGIDVTGIEPGQYASMPVVCEDGEYKIIENLQVEPWLEHRLKQHYEIENTSSGQDLEDFIEYSKWMIDLVKRDEAQKPVSFPSPEDVSKMDEETQKMLRRRITLLNPQEAILHDREWYPEGFEVTSSTGIVPPPKLTKKIKNKRKRRKLRRKKPFNKFPDTWSTTGQDLDVIPLLDQPINTAVFTEEDEFFMFDYRKALLHGAEPKEWWPKYLEFKEKTKDPKGLATVYESMLESLLEIETKTGTKIFTPDQLEEHRKKIEEIRNTPSQVKQVQDTFNPLEQAMIPQSMTPENLPQQPAVLARSTQAPQKPTLTHRFVDTDHIPYDSYGKPHPEYGPDEDEEEASKYDIDAIGALEKWRNPPLMSPYPEKPTEKDQKDLDAEKLKQTELEEERRKAIEEQQEKMDEEEEKEEEELGEQQQFVPTFWIREFEKEVDPWKTNPDEKFEDFLAPQHRFVWDLIQEAKAKGLSEVRQEIKMSPEDFEFMKKQRVPKTDIIDLSYIPKEGVPLRNVPKDEDGEVEETEQPK